MPNSTVRAADEGLPNSAPPSVLIEGATGHAVSRLKAAKATRPSMLTGDALEAFLAKLEEFVSVEQKIQYLGDLCNDRGSAKAEELCETAKSIRRKMISPLTKIREAKSKTLEDILFKAYVSEIIDAHGHRRSTSVLHSIANDLLSAECIWRAA
jgi:hypothetical protein